jgi:hypothetical protein
VCTDAADFVKQNKWERYKSAGESYHHHPVDVPGRRRPQQTRAQARRVQPMSQEIQEHTGPQRPHAPPRGLLQEGITAH